MVEDRAEFTVIDAHVHVHPDLAADLASIMDDNRLASIVNLGVLERLGIPFEVGMDTFRKTLGDRLVYFPTPDFGDVAPGFGERMAQALERKVEAGAGGLKIFKELGLRIRDASDHLVSPDDRRLDPEPRRQRPQDRVAHGGLSENRSLDRDGHPGSPATRYVEYSTGTDAGSLIDNRGRMASTGQGRPDAACRGSILAT